MSKSNLLFRAILISTAVTLSLLSCPPPYTLLNGFCLFWNFSDRPFRSWCNSARLCQSINGKLALGIERARAARHLSSTLMFIGATDFLVERFRNKSGWLMTNGQEFPLLGDKDWAPNCPSNKNDLDETLAIKNTGLMDSTSGGKDYLCQPIETPNSSVLKRSNFLKLGAITPYYCFTDMAVVDEFACLIACANRWECRAALVNTVIGQCRMLDYSDASVGDVIELDPNWRRYIKLY